MCDCGLPRAQFNLCDAERRRLAGVRDAALAGLLEGTTYADDLVLLTALYQRLYINGEADITKIPARLLPRIQEKYRRGRALRSLANELFLLRTTYRLFSQFVVGELIRLINKAGTIEGATIGEDSSDLRTLNINDIERQFTAGTLLTEQGTLNTAVARLEQTSTDALDNITITQAYDSGRLVALGGGTLAAVGIFASSVVLLANVAGSISVVALGITQLSAGGVFAVYIASGSGAIAALQIGGNAFGTISLVASGLGGAVAGIAAAVGLAVVTGGLSILFGIVLFDSLRAAPTLRDRRPGEDFVSQNDLDEFLTNEEVLRQYRTMAVQIDDIRDAIAELGRTFAADYEEAITDLIPASIERRNREIVAEYDRAVAENTEDYCSETCTAAESQACRDRTTCDTLYRARAVNGVCVCEGTSRTCACAQSIIDACAARGTSYTLTTDCICRSQEPCPPDEILRCQPTGTWETVSYDTVSCLCRRTQIACTPTEITVISGRSTETELHTPTWDTVTSTCRDVVITIEPPDDPDAEPCTEEQVRMCAAMGQAINPNTCGCEDGCSAAERLRLCASLNTRDASWRTWAAFYDTSPPTGDARCRCRVTETFGCSPIQIADTCASLNTRDAGWRTWAARWDASPPTGEARCRCFGTRTACSPSQLATGCDHLDDRDRAGQRFTAMWDAETSRCVCECTTNCEDEDIPPVDDPDDGTEDDTGDDGEEGTTDEEPDGEGEGGDEDEEGCADADRAACTPRGAWETATFDEATCDCNRRQIACTPTQAAAINEANRQNPRVNITPRWNAQLGICEAALEIVTCNDTYRRQCLGQNSDESAFTFTWRDHTHPVIADRCSCLTERKAVEDDDGGTTYRTTGSFNCFFLPSEIVNFVREGVLDGTFTLTTACNGYLQERIDNPGGANHNNARFAPDNRNYGLQWHPINLSCCNVCVEEGKPYWNVDAQECQAAPPVTTDDPPDCPTGTVRLADGLSCGEAPPRIVVPPTPGEPDTPPVAPEPPPSPCAKLRYSSDVNAPATPPRTTAPIFTGGGCRLAQYRAPVSLRVEAEANRRSSDVGLRNSAERWLAANP